MNFVKKDKKSVNLKTFELQKPKTPARHLRQIKNPKGKNLSLFSFIGTTLLACNTSTDDQCYGGLGVIVGSLCANKNNLVENTEVKLTQVASSEPYLLQIGMDSDGKKIIDAIQFINKADVTGTKHTLTDGDILKDPGTVFLDLINTGSIDGQEISGSEEIEITSQGTTVVLVSDWYNNDVITIKNSDRSVTLNDLQSTKLDSARAEDNVFYPNTFFRVEDVNAPDQAISFYFNEEAILGTSTELDLLIKDSVVNIQAGVFVDPDTTADDQNAEVEIDPFLVAPDTNIEKLNLHIADNGNGSRIVDLIFSGLETLAISGGLENNQFEITDPLESSLKNISAVDVPADLVLDVSDSTLKKTILFGSGNDILILGNSLVEAPVSDRIDGGEGRDKLIVTLGEGTTNVAPVSLSFEELDIAFNSEAIFDFSNFSDLELLNVLDSTSGVSLTNVPFDLHEFNVGKSQTGNWSLSFENNAAAKLNLNWSNNTEATSTLNNIGFDEVQSLSILGNGASDVIFTALSVDSDDTELLSVTNTGDGNLVFSPNSQLDTFDGLTGISIITTEGGNVTIGSAASSFGISDALKLSTINLVASETGIIELGSIGTSTSIEDLQSISITSSGANVLLGSIVASNSGTFSASIAKSATVSLGNIDFANQADSFVALGSGTLSPITFLNEAYSIINLSDLITGSDINFSNADLGVTIFAGSGNDNLTLGLGADVVTGNEGEDTFIINNGATGLTFGTSDVINDFKSGEDKLKLGLLGDGTLDTGNYVESSTSVADYSNALVAANTALKSLNDTSSATELYAFQYDSSFGYLFIDHDSDGVANDLVILGGVESDLISASDIIA